MNNKWNDIVISLSDCKERKVSESEYQRRIEEQMKFLGWSFYNGCVESKPQLHIGNSNSIIPDIVLKKDGSRVLTIEVKEPNNVLTHKQEEQLYSYMRQLMLPVGLYIGEKFSLYYNEPENRHDPICVLSIPLEMDSSEGIELCQYLLYDNFSLANLEKFCKDMRECRRFQHEISLKINQCDTKKQLSDTLTTLIEEVCDVELYKKALIAELTIRLGKDNNVVKGEKHERQNKRTNNVRNNDTDKKDADKAKKCSIDLNDSVSKRMFVFQALKLYVEMNPNASFAQIEKTFPKETQRHNYGVVRKFEDLKAKAERRPDILKRYFTKDSMLLKSGDGIVFSVCNQWDYQNFPNFVELLKKLGWVINQE